MLLFAPTTARSPDRAQEADNPSRKTWIAAVGGVVLVAGAATLIAFTRRGAPPTDPGQIKNYVGAPGYVWPEHDRFPNERAFGLALQNLGYDSGVNAATFSILSPQAMSAVKGFQRDYNIVRLTNWEFVDQETQGVGQPDGLIGDKTIEALLNAEAWIASANLSWADLLAVSKTNQKIP